MGPIPGRGSDCVSVVEIERQSSYTSMTIITAGPDPGVVMEPVAALTETGFALELPTTAAPFLPWGKERPFAYPRPASGSTFGRGSDAVAIYLSSNSVANYGPSGPWRQSTIFLY